jgi:hypothetical protein
MEMSWWALLSTILVALIIAGAALIPSGERVSVDSAKAAEPGGPLPTFGGAVRNGIVFRTNAGEPNPTLIVCGVMYGIAMAFFDLFLPSHNAEQPGAHRKA